MLMDTFVGWEWDMSADQLGTTPYNLEVKTSSSYCTIVGIFDTCWIRLRRRVSRPRPHSLDCRFSFQFSMHKKFPDPDSLYKRVVLRVHCIDVGGSYYGVGIVDDSSVL